MAAASARRTGAEKDAAGVAAPGDTKVSDAMGYPGETTMPGSQKKKRKDKSAEKNGGILSEGLASLICLLKCVFGSFFWFCSGQNVFEEKLSWRLLFENS